MSKINNSVQQIGVPIILVRKNKILLGERVGGYMPGAMGLPGGRVEFGEKLTETAERELLEEVGLKSNNFEYIGTIREDQNDYIFIHFVYKCSQFFGEVKNMEPNKCKGWNWYSLDKLPKNILKGHAAAIELLMNNGHLIDLSS